MILTQRDFSGAIHWLTVIVVLLVAFWLRAHALDQYPPGISNDEAVNVIDAFHIHRTGLAPAYEDKGRPESPYRIVTGIAMGVLGDTVWAARLSGTFWSMVTLAVVYWLTAEVLHDTDRKNRRLAGLVALITMTIMIGHITFSRALYRAIPQVLFVALSAGFILRGLRTLRWRDFVWSGFFGALALYVYPVAYFYPPALVVLGLSLFVLRLRQWRQWLPRMILAAVIMVIVAAPLLYLATINTEAILGRAQDVAIGQSQDWNRAITTMVNQFLIRGDENPQYNVARAPIIPPILQPIFYLGLLGLIARALKPSSWFIVSMLVLFTIPALASNEITHGLRISSEYIVVPVIVAFGIGTVLHLLPMTRWPALQWVNPVIVIGAIVVLIYGSSIAWQTYRDYWEHPDEWKSWRIFERTLDHNEWFFRTDRRDFAEWIITQETPLLLPVDELNQQTTRAWLLNDYPHVTTAGRDFALPENIHLIVPYELGLGDLMRDTRDFALLNVDTITLLPPLSASTHQTLLEGIESGTPIERAGVELNFLGYSKAIPDDFILEFEPLTVASDNAPLAIFGDDEIYLNGWSGSTNLTHRERLDITLNWSPTRKLRHEYLAVLQLQTQDFERIAGDEDFVFVHRWLYPSTLWQVGDIVPDHHAFDIPPDLAPGAYRLVASVKYTNYPPIQAMSDVSETVNNMATIGWLKVPQPDNPTPPDDNLPMDVEIGDSFQLTSVEVLTLENNQTLVRLYWRSMIDRPPLDATIFVHATDNDNAIAAQSDTRPWNGQYPTFIWDEGEVVVSEHLLATETLDLSTLNLRVGMYTFPGPQNISAIVDGAVISNGLIELGALEDYVVGN